MAEQATPSTALDAGRLVGLLADDDRRRVFAAVELGGTTLDAAATLAGLPVPRAAKALSTLAGAGLVVQGDGGGLYVVGAAFQLAAREALSRPSTDEHADRPDEVRRVFDAFVRDGRLTQIPTARQKRLVVLDWLAQDFDPGTRYSEPMVNLILGKRHADTAALRRYLVDEGLLDRAGGEYWRTGGTVELDPSQPSIIRTHYDVLGIPNDADPVAIHSAYRDRARLNHPDHAGDASADDMSAINEAYRVLGDDTRRAAYDRELEGGALPSEGTPFVPPATTTARRPAPGPPARIPWRLMGAMAAIGIAVVLIGAATRKPDTVRPPDGVLETGSCVVLETNGDASETNCEGDGDLVVEVVVAFDATCPAGTEPHRDSQGLGIACVIPISSR